MKPLTERAFFEEYPVRNATLAIEKARQQFIARTRTDGVSFEVVAPTDVDETWVHRNLLHPLVYFCESEQRPIPLCSGVFLSLFVGDALFCIAIPDVMAWTKDQLGLDADELRARYGTHERETVLR